MAQPYIGEIRMFAGNFAPVGWNFCEGQLLPISEYEPLFNLIGTTYGGDGESTFALPDMRGRIPLHQGNNYLLAETGGAETVTLSVNQIPSHTHALLASSGAGSQASPKEGFFAGHRDHKVFANTQSPQAYLSPSTVIPVGGSQPHYNFPPYLCVNFIISLFGIFPSQT